MPVESTNLAGQKIKMIGDSVNGVAEAGPATLLVMETECSLYLSCYPEN